MNDQIQSRSRRSFLYAITGLGAALASLSGWFAAGRGGPARRTDAVPATRGGLSFAQFMTLSAQLTGVPRGQLDEAAGRVYFASLPGNANEQDILLCWYTGKYATPQGVAVHTWDEALAWSTLGFTTAQMQCHPDWWLPPAKLPQEADEREHG